MNTTTDACEVAYAIYRQLRPITREAINDRLVALGHQGISERTYRHLGKLASHGYDHYLPINQLDVRHSHSR